MQTMTLPPAALVAESAESDASITPELDLVEEMRLRTWARRNYVVRAERVSSWHPVVHHEMARIDRESLA